MSPKNFIVNFILNSEGVIRVFFNPSSPNSDQDQFSSNNIHTLSRDKL